MMKKCFKCNIINDIQMFYKNISMLDGHLNKCIECTKKDVKELYENTSSEIHRARRRAYDSANRDKKSKWSLKFIKNNPHKANAQTAKRLAQKLQATPVWLTKEHHKEMLEFYKLAKELQWLSEERLEVDHIIPLVSDFVCGLHVPWNLQILPKSENVRKGNRLK